MNTLLVLIFIIKLFSRSKLFNIYVYTHFHSFLPSVYKFGLISLSVHLEVLGFKRIFFKNGYPLKILDACIQKFLHKVFTKKVQKIDVPKKEYNILLPYLGPLSNKITRRIKTAFQRIIPAGKINITFKNERSLSHFFRFKDRNNSALSSHHIYHFKCPSCNAGYIGETRVHNKIRSSQHLGISE